MRYIIMLLIGVFMVGCAGNNSEGSKTSDSTGKVNMTAGKAMETQSLPNFSLAINTGGGDLKLDALAISEMMKRYGELPQSETKLDGKTNVSSQFTEKIAEWYKSTNPWTLFAYAVGLGLLLMVIKHYIIDPKKVARGLVKQGSRLLKSLDETIKNNDAEVKSLESMMTIAPPEKTEVIKAKIQQLQRTTTEAKESIQRHHNKKGA